MDIKKIIDISGNPKPYDKGTSVMWTDQRITPRLLDAHLNENINSASRTPYKINKTINYIIENINAQGAAILDLGCGPGLYAERLAGLGFKVTGIDFSQNSIDYAKKSAKEKSLDIEYICGDYIEIGYKGKFDAVVMIYCDFGVLSDKERNLLVNKVYEALRPGGVFIFDSLNENALHAISFTKNWEYSKTGFWRNNPYICLSENIYFEEIKAILAQHIVIEQNGEFEVYRFWNHFFDDTDIKSLFLPAGFAKVHSDSNVISDSADGTGDITFFKVTK